MDKLAACPFCGGRAILESLPYGGSAWEIHCGDCGTQQAEQYGPEIIAISAWNRRAVSPRQAKMEAVVEAAKAMLFDNGGGELLIESTPRLSKNLVEALVALQGEGGA